MAAGSIIMFNTRLLTVFLFLACLTVRSEAQDLPVSGPGGKPVTISTVTGDKIFDRIHSGGTQNIGFWLVDLRPEAEFYRKFIPGAINIPLKKLSFMAEKLFMPADNIVFYGYAGLTHDAVNACTFMKQKGFDNCVVLENGIGGWPGYFEQGKPE